MRVVIDASSLLLRSAGIKSYTWHWLRALQRLTSREEVRAFPFIDLAGRLDHDRSVLGFWQTLTRITLLHGVNWSSGLLDFVLGDADLFHASNQVRRMPTSTRVTATLHDLTCWLMPELHTPANVRADREFAGRVLNRAARVIAVSESTRQDAIRVLRMSPERIETIHSGVADEFFDAKPVYRARPYVLFLGAIEPRKNIETLLDGWRSVRGELRESFDLVIAGASGWGPPATLARIKREAAYLGYVPEPQLPGLTAGATVFVYPSLYEGFGFPVAQAMAAGVPVITSNTSALPEICGDSGLLVDPRSPSEICAAITRVLEDHTFRAELGARGRKRADRFRWDVTAKKSIEFFRNVAG
jgi:glycosyltransferase involved in cell wall biosynthesis